MTDSFSVYHCYTDDDGQQWRPYLATFRDKPEAEWYAKTKLETQNLGGYMAIVERKTGMTWEISNGTDN